MLKISKANSPNVTLVYFIINIIINETSFSSQYILFQNIGKAPELSLYIKRTFLKHFQSNTSNRKLSIVTHTVIGIRLYVLQGHYSL